LVWSKKIVIGTGGGTPVKSTGGGGAPTGLDLFVGEPGALPLPPPSLLVGGDLPPSLGSGEGDLGAAEGGEREPRGASGEVAVRPSGGEDGGAEPEFWRFWPEFCRGLTGRFFGTGLPSGKTQSGSCLLVRG
jgi:hypothetical protein